MRNYEKRLLAGIVVFVITAMTVFVGIEIVIWLSTLGMSLKSAAITMIALYGGINAACDDDVIKKAFDKGEG